MNAFNDFATIYEWMFPWDKRWQTEGAFFRQLFKECGVRSVLDCACGTGRHVIQFARLGLSAHGSDISPNMIEAAALNARKERVAVDLRISSFTTLTTVFKPEERFDAVICVGNSLTLAPTDGDVAQALRQMHDVLNPGGTCIIHVFNWDKLAVEGLRIMPAAARAIDGQDTTVLRVFHHRGDVIDLHLVVITKVGDRVETQIRTTGQRPVGPDRLRSFVFEAGFTCLELYGSYQWPPFDAQKSDQLVLVARK